MGGKKPLQQPQYTVIEKHLSNSDKVFIIALALITWMFIIGIGMYLSKLVVAAA